MGKTQGDGHLGGFYGTIEAKGRGAGTWPSRPSLGRGKSNHQRICLAQHYPG